MLSQYENTSKHTFQPSCPSYQPERTLGSIKWCRQTTLHCISPWILIALLSPESGMMMVLVPVRFNDLNRLMLSPLPATAGTGNVQLSLLSPAVCKRVGEPVTGRILWMKASWDTTQFQPVWFIFPPVVAVLTWDGMENSSRQASSLLIHKFYAVNPIWDTYPLTFFSTSYPTSNTNSSKYFRHGNLHVEKVPSDQANGGVRSPAKCNLTDLAAVWLVYWDILFSVVFVTKG